MVLCPVCRRTPENPQINLRLIPIPITPIRACLQDLADPIASKLAPTRSASIKATIVGAGLPAMPATGFVCRIELIPSPASWLLQGPPLHQGHHCGSWLASDAGNRFVYRIELIPSPASWLLQDPPPIKATIVGAGLPAMPATGFVCRIELIPSPASWLLQGPPPHQSHHCGSWLASDAGNRVCLQD